MSSEKPLFWQQPAGGWIAGCRRQGFAHKVAGTACQDHRMAKLIHPDGVVGCAMAVADGHGGRRHDRSAVGARIATRLATLLLRRLCRSADDDSLAGCFRDDFPRWMVRQWRRRVLDDAATPGEPPSAIVDRYGTTLIVGLCTAKSCLVGQIGDGEALLLRRTGMVRLIEPDLTTVGLATHSLCQRAAHRYWRIHAGRALEPGDILLLATDGFADSFASEGDLNRFADDLWQRCDAFGPSRVASCLPGWLDRLSRDGSGDDITLMMASPWAKRHAP